MLPMLAHRLPISSKVRGRADIGNSRTGGRIQLAIYRAVIVTKFLSHN